MHRNEASIAKRDSFAAIEFAQAVCVEVIAQFKDGISKDIDRVPVIEACLGAMQDEAPTALYGNGIIPIQGEHLKTQWFHEDYAAPACMNARPVLQENWHLQQSDQAQ
jgi:hypothetical protein